MYKGHAEHFTDIFAIISNGTKSLDQIFDMSMGEIAMAVLKNHPLKMGKITFINKDRIAFRYVDPHPVSCPNGKLNILSVSSGLYLEGVPFETVSDREISDKQNYEPLKVNLFVAKILPLPENLKPDLLKVIQSCGNDGY